MVNQWKYVVGAVLISTLLIACALPHIAKQGSDIYLEPVVYLVYEAQSSRAGVLTEGQMADLLTTIQQRVDAFAAGRVRKTEGNRIRVELWGGVELEEAKSLIGEPALLEFKERTCKVSTCLTYTDADLGLTGDNLDNAYASTSQNTGEWTVNIQFNGRGADIFSDVTRRISTQQDTKRIAVFLDGELLLASVSRAWIPDGRAVITGNFSREEARILSIKLEFGRLSHRMVLIEEGTVEPKIGTRRLIIGLVMVMIIGGLAAIVMKRLTGRKLDST